MTTVAEQGELIKRRLIATARGRYNFLAEAGSDTDESFVFEDELLGVQAGNLIGIGDEICYVRTVGVPGRTVSVRRGWMGTIPMAYDVATPVEMSPRFPSADIVDTMAEELLAWSPQLFVPRSTVIPTSSGVRSYDSGAGTDELLFGLDLTWPQTRWSGTGATESHSRPNFRLLRDQDPAAYPSGVAVEFDLDPGPGEARFVYGTSYPVDLATWAPATDLTALGVTPDQLDVLRYGVMWRLMSSREIGRADMHSFGESRKAEDVPAGSQLNITRTLLQLHDKCLAGAANALRDRYPYRRG